MKRTLGLNIYFQKDANGSIGDDVALIAYSDANHGSTEDRKSTSGYLFYLNGCPVSWKSKRQGMVTISSTEAEIVALSEAGREALWLMRFLKDLGLSVSTLMYEDNQAAIYMVNGSGDHQRSKHIDIRDKFIQSLVARKLVNVEHCPTQEMVADLFTKALPRGQVQKFTDMLKLRQILQ